MKNQALFSLKDKSKKLKCRLLQFLFDTLRVKMQVWKEQSKQAVHCLPVHLHLFDRLPEL